MEFKHDKSLDCLTEIFTSKVTAKSAWNKFIDFHEHTTPNTYWEALRQLEIDKEQEGIVEWLHELVTVSPILESISGIWIGLTKYENNDKEIPVIYLSGADNYQTDNADWTSNPIYFPSNNYAQLPLLQQIDDIIKTDEENYEFLDWIFPLAYCVFTIDEIIRLKLNKELFLTHKRKLFVAVGHDNGDYLDIAIIE